MIPALPTKLAGHDMDPEELHDLWRRLVLELMDEKYNGRTHHNRRTYDAGCRGPLCSKAVRERGRLRSQTSPNERYKWVDPILDFWCPVAERRIEAARARILKQLAG